MLNRVVIMGRLTRDPDARITPNGTAVTNFTLAVDRDYKDKSSGEKITDFFDVVAWRSTADYVSNYFSKGRMAIVEGQLQARSWVDKEGKKRIAIEIIADSVYFGDSKKDGTAQPASPSSGYRSAPQKAVPVQSDYQVVDELDADSGDLPF